MKHAATRRPARLRKLLAGYRYSASRNKPCPHSGMRHEPGATRGKRHRARP